MEEFLIQNQWLIVVLQLWTVPWKGLGLWVAAKKGNKLWFIALLLLQTLGILEIIYIFFVAKYRFDFHLNSIFKKKK